MAAQARFGERVPVPVTTFAPIATGGVQTQPITSFNYENIGVNIDITPRTHHDDDVSLALKVEVSSISGTGFGGLPTFGNRAINTVIRLKDGETNMLAGLIRDDERRVMAGMPGLSDLPLIGRLFAATARDAGDRHHPHADAAHRPRAGPDRGRSAPVPGRPRRRDRAAPWIDRRPCPKPPPPACRAARGRRPWPGVPAPAPAPTARRRRDR
jgi:hypothetical protein